MRVSTYGKMSELISDLARLDKKIQPKRYRAVLDALDGLPSDDFQDGQVLEYLTTLAYALERLAKSPDGRHMSYRDMEDPPETHGPKNIGGKAEAWTCPHCKAENIGDPIEKGRCAKCGRHWDAGSDNRRDDPDLPGPL